MWAKIKEDTSREDSEEKRWQVRSIYRGVFMVLGFMV